MSGVPHSLHLQEQSLLLLAKDFDLNPLCQCFFLITVKNGLLHNQWWANVDFIIDLCRGHYPCSIRSLQIPFYHFVLCLPYVTLWLLACNTLYNSSSVNTVLHNRARSAWELIRFLHPTLDQWLTSAGERASSLTTSGDNTKLYLHSRVHLWDQADFFL